MPGRQMNVLMSLRSPRGVAAAVAAALGALMVGPSFAATIIGDLVDITLSSPADSISATDSGVLVGAGQELNPSTPGSNIAGYLLTGATANEFADLGATTITLRLLSGATDGSGNAVTGFGAGATYIFSSLNNGYSVTGVSGTSSGISNFSSSWIHFLAHQVSFDIDAIHFIPAVGTTFGDVTLNLTLMDTAPPPPPPPPGVPEPGSLALVGMSLVGAWAAKRAAATRR